MKIERKILLIMLVVLLVMLCFTVWYRHHVRTGVMEEQAAAQEAEMRSRFSTLTDRNGEPVSLTIDDGKVRVVTHFASWCPACLNDVLTLREVAEDFSAEQVDFVAIDRKETKSVLDAYLISVALDDLSLVRIVVDTEDTHYRSVDGYTMPESVIYDQRGEVAQHIRGPLDKVTLEETLKNLLATP